MARLGSVKAAAAALGVSEPAISDAVGVLRRELGDELYVRAGGAIELTSGGQRLAAAAGEILGLAEQARRAVREARGETAMLRVAATASVAEFAAGPLLDAFTRRNPNVEVSLQVARAPDFGGLLSHRLADVALGPRLVRDGAGFESVPFLRYGSVVVASPRHPLARARGIAPATLAGETWLVGPSGAEPSTATGAFLARERIMPREVLAFPSFANARAQAVLDGVLDQLVEDHRQRGGHGRVHPHRGGLQLDVDVLAAERSLQHPDDPPGHVGHVDRTLELLGEGLVDQGDRGDSAHRVLQGGHRLGVVAEPAGL
ncbi:MAG TPA: LysR family transcriptional regulator, partial [Solirubrobacteraceae bacterium]|nr:LysR family transcriptional regulator [Solirubrobacteraceae bacterium]